MFEPLASLFSSIWPGFSQWLRGITYLDFIWMFWPLIVVDTIRSVGKSIILLGDWVMRRLRKKSDDPLVYPMVSLIIPAHNEEKAIEQAIQAALETVYPNKEVIVVDDGSTDRTLEIAKPYADKRLIKLIHRDDASGSKSGALNYGILFSTGDVIISVDADTLLERGAIMEMLKPFSDPGVNAVSGNVRILRGEKGADNLIVKLQAYEYVQSLELGRRFASLANTLLIISGAFGAFRKKDIVSLGVYSTDTITEDFDATIKVRKMNKKIVFADKAVSWTFAPETWKAWRRQRIRWTRGQFETIMKHRNVLRGGGFNLSFVVAVYDMILIDFLLLFVRTLWLPVFIVIYREAALYILALMFILYLGLETSQFIVAGILSPRKDDLKKAPLIPVMVLFYRPYYSLIRFQAYIQSITKRGKQW
jgi:cellulose synthase/poly-beta-1,6-N-acetylglucosamine synthase-like glycosyltransferase